MFSQYFFNLFVNFGLLEFWAKEIKCGFYLTYLTLLGPLRTKLCKKPKNKKNVIFQLNRNKSKNFPSAQMNFTHRVVSLHDALFRCIQEEFSRKKLWELADYGFFVYF